MDTAAARTADINQLFTDYAAGLCLYARQWLGSSAEDAVQEAFVKLLSQSKLPDNIKAWLYRTVRNESISRLRKKRVRDEAARTIKANGRFWFQPDIDKNLDAEIVQQAVNELEVELREVVTLRLWGQLGFEEMSEITGVAVSTLHNRYHRAMKLLRDKLG